MREYIKKLQEKNSGSARRLTPKERKEFAEFMAARGVTDYEEPITEADAVKLFKRVKPQTYSFRAAGRY